MLGRKKTSPLAFPLSLIATLYAFSLVVTAAPHLVNQQTAEATTSDFSQDPQEARKALEKLSSQDRQQIEKAAAKLSPQDRQQIEQALGQLSSQERQQLEEGIEQLSPEERQQLERGIEQLSPEERKALIERAKDQLGKGPVVRNVIVGPTIPVSYVVRAAALMGKVPRPSELTDDSARLFEAAKTLLPNIVSIQRRDVTGYSDSGVGNGLLISKGMVLTARHVAELVSAAPEKYSLFQIGDGDRLMIQLVFIEKVAVGTDNSGDPDLALIRVQGGGNPNKVSFATGVLHVRDSIASLGSSEMEDIFPSMGTGIITTSVRQRELAETLALKRTVFGSSVRSFPGLSGSPVFNAHGEIIAVLIGGVKLYAGTGERVTTVGKEVNWEAFKDWTWATPTQPFLKTQPLGR